MRKDKKDCIGVALVLVGALAILAVALLLTITVQAKTPHNGRVKDAQGNIYIYKHGKMQTGWFRYHGKTYYGHKTKSRMYPRGSVACNTYRVKNGRMYYMGNSGARQTKNSHYIKLNKCSKSVHYIIMPGMGAVYRYNANHRRYQYRTKGGKWVDVGMQCYPVGMIDFQE